MGGYFCKNEKNLSMSGLELMKVVQAELPAELCQADNEQQALIIASTLPDFTLTSRAKALVQKYYAMRDIPTGHLANQRVSVPI
ncbi:MAG: hypothetical protein WCO23_03605 [bacterium]